MVILMDDNTPEIPQKWGTQVGLIINPILAIWAIILKICLNLVSKTMGRNMGAIIQSKVQKYASMAVMLPSLFGSGRTREMEMLHKILVLVHISNITRATRDILTLVSLRTTRAGVAK
jgi:hypothetical protein